MSAECSKYLWTRVRFKRVSQRADSNAVLIINAVFFEKRFRVEYTALFLHSIVTYYAILARIEGAVVSASDGLKN